jgi:hypothetical protein
MSNRIAHFLLDILCKQSVSGGQQRADADRLKSSPPPAPVGLRGVAVVQRESALRTREELT